MGINFNIKLTLALESIVKKGGAFLMHFKSTEKRLKGTTKLNESTKVCLEYHKWGHPLLAKDNLFNLQL
jgi:hypothetical protein